MTTATKIDHAHPSDETQIRIGVVVPFPTPTGKAQPKQRPASGATAYPRTKLAARMFMDALDYRKAFENRLRGGIEPPHVDLAKDAINAGERAMRRALRDSLRAEVDPAILDWQKNTVGIGEHTLGLLLGATGHPVHATRYRWEGEGTDRVLIEDGPITRRVSDLWSYCGHGDPTRRRAKGMTAHQAAALGNPQAKLATYLLAEACMKSTASPYRQVYVDARERYATRDGWTPGHQHAAALRLTGKTILKDLWVIAGGGHAITKEDAQ